MSAPGWVTDLGVDLVMVKDLEKATGRERAKDSAQAMVA